jgi:dehydrogenase/reductase SDR family protein 12
MSIYRNTVWFVKGMREYTASGYQAAAKHFKPEDLEVDCSGKSYMITGILPIRRDRHTCRYTSPT